MPLQLYDDRQDESKSFSKICFVPSLGLSCFGCCGHHFKDKETMHKFFDNNKKTLQRYLKKGKSYNDFMWRQFLLDPCGGCTNLVRDKNKDGTSTYVCSVHPLRIGGEDIRIGYCEHDYLCKSAAHVNKMTEEEKELFYDFIRDMKFDSYTYSLINSKETILIELYRGWKTKGKKGKR